LVEIDRTVPCPSRPSTPLAVCRACEDLQEIAHHPDGRERAVVCHANGPLPNCGSRYSWAHLFARGLSADADHIPVAAAMSCDVTCVTLDISVEAVASLFLDERIGAVPVVDYEGYPIGIVSKTDLVRDIFGGGGEAAYRLAALDRQELTDLMTPVVYTVRDNDSLATAATVISEHRVHHAPVVDAEGRCVGMISAFDLARWIAGGTRPRND
jgi:Mg/Co/Ni transporter MgtE